MWIQTFCSRPIARGLVSIASVDLSRVSCPEIFFNRTAEPAHHQDPQPGTKSLSMQIILGAQPNSLFPNFPKTILAHMGIKLLSQ